MSRIVKVSSDDCIACGLCVSVLPEVFRFENGKSTAYDPFGASELKIQGCIDGCPVGAIRWNES
jgi:ferredoxin